MPTTSAPAPGSADSALPRRVPWEVEELLATGFTGRITMDCHQGIVRAAEGRAGARGDGRVLVVLERK